MYIYVQCQYRWGAGFALIRDSYQPLRGVVQPDYQLPWQNILQLTRLLDSRDMGSGVVYVRRAATAT